MNRFAFIGLIFLVSCALGGGESRSNPAIERPSHKLCIKNEYGLPIHAYSQYRKIGVYMPGTYCHELTISNMGPELSGEVLLRSKDGNHVVLPYTDYSAASVWSLTLRPWARTWDLDAIGLQPAKLAK